MEGMEIAFLEVWVVGFRFPCDHGALGFSHRGRIFQDEHLYARFVLVRLTVDICYTAS